MNLYIKLAKAVSQMPNTGVDTPTEDQSVAENESSYAKRPVGVAEGESQDPDSPDVGGKWPHSKDNSVMSEVKAKRKARSEEASKDGTVKKAQPFDGGFTREEVARTAKELNVDFSEEDFSLEQLISGMNVEREHADVSKTAKVIGKIALAHLRESGDYYKKLKKMESEEVSKGLEILRDLNKSLTELQAAYTPNPREQEFLQEVLGYSEDDINKGVAVIVGRNRSLFNRWLCDKLTQATNDLNKSVGANFVR